MINLIVNSFIFCYLSPLFPHARSLQPDSTGVSSEQGTAPPQSVQDLLVLQG